MKRNISLDILKLLLVLLVLVTHCIPNDTLTVFSYLSKQGLFRIAVPIFLIINGYYFYNIIENKGFYKWFKKILILYTIWMIFYSYFWFYIPELSPKEIAKLFHKIITGYYHLWYISGLFFAACMLIAVRNSSLRFIVFSISVCYLAGCAIQYLGNYQYFEGNVLNKFFNQHWTHRNAVLFSYPYFSIGYLIKKYSLHDKVDLKKALLVSNFGLIALLLESLYTYYDEGCIGGFDNYFSLIIACPFIFIIFIKMDHIGQGKNLSLLATSIYLIHPVFISIINKILDSGTFLLSLNTLILSFVASLFLIKINRKIKYVL